jgi:ribonucleotide monophosphatase NagD (HAD superfamily)
MPGGIMEEYKRRGGKVFGFGKPFRDVFSTAIDLATTNTVAKSNDDDLLLNKRIIHVGDSLHHDIAGELFFRVFSL